MSALGREQTSPLRAGSGRSLRVRGHGPHKLQADLCYNTMAVWTCPELVLLAGACSLFENAMCLRG